MKNELSSEAQFLLANKELKIDGYKPNFETIRSTLEKQIDRPIYITIDEDLNGHIKATIRI